MEKQVLQELKRQMELQKKHILDFDEKVGLGEWSIGRLSIINDVLNLIDYHERYKTN